jgi:hypothetical protein
MRPLALILGLIGILELSETMTLIILVLAFKFSAGGPRVVSLPMTFVTYPFALVVAAILELVGFNFSLR